MNNTIKPVTKSNLKCIWSNNKQVSNKATSCYRYNNKQAKKKNKKKQFQISDILDIGNLGLDFICTFIRFLSVIIHLYMNVYGEF